MDRTGLRVLWWRLLGAGASLDWHNAPHRQYVITLSCRLEFETRTGERWVVEPGDILLAEVTSGGGYRWRLIDDQLWRRVYVACRKAPAAEGTHEVMHLPHRGKTSRPIGRASTCYWLMDLSEFQGFIFHSLLKPHCKDSGLPAWIC